MSLTQNQIDRINAILEEVEAPVKKWPYEEKDVFAISTNGIIYSEPHYKEMRLSKIYPTPASAQYAFDKQELLYELQAFADELNGDWIPDWNDVGEKKYIIYYNSNRSKFTVDYWMENQYLNQVWFKERKHAHTAIDKFAGRFFNRFNIYN